MNELKKIITVAKYSFYEIYKSKIMLAMIVWGVALLLLTYIASELTYGVPEKMALSFGMGFLSISTLGIAVFYGAYLISSEIQNSTFLMVLSRPIKRSSFLLGKLIGVKLVLALNVAFWGVLTTVVYILLGGEFHWLLVESIFFVFLQAVILLLLVVLFSLLTNLTISVICTFSIYVFSYLGQGILEFTYVKTRSFLGVIFKGLNLLLPDFSLLNLKEYLIYKNSLPFSFKIQALSYGVVYSLALYFLIVFIFSKKSLE